MKMKGVTKGKIKRPLLMCLFGTEGVGKTTFASQAESPIFIGPETGTDNLDVARFQTPKTFTEILGQCEQLLSEKHEFKTVVFDSLDWIERALFTEILAEDTKAKSIEDIGGGYGRYVGIVNNHWEKLIAVTKQLRDKGMNIIFIAHYQVKTFNDPMTSLPYDRYIMKLLEKTSALFREYVDILGFATFEVVSKGDGSNAKKGKGRGDGVRILYTEKRPAHDAKNRFGLPYAMPLDFGSLISSVGLVDDDKINELKRDINDLVLDIKDSSLVEKVKETIIKADNNYQTLLAIKNRLMVINGGN
jgi:hypothetical protein